MYLRSNSQIVDWALFRWDGVEVQDVDDDSRVGAGGNVLGAIRPGKSTGVVTVHQPSCALVNEKSEISILTLAYEIKY